MVLQVAKFKPFFLIGEDPELRKGVIILLHRKEGGLERHSLNVIHKMPR